MRPNTATRGFVLKVKATTLLCVISAERSSRIRLLQAASNSLFVLSPFCPGDFETTLHKKPCEFLHQKCNTTSEHLHLSALQLGSNRIVGSYYCGSHHPTMETIFIYSPLNRRHMQMRTRTGNRQEGDCICKQQQTEMAQVKDLSSELRHGQSSP